MLKRRQNHNSIIERLRSRAKQLRGKLSHCDLTLVGVSRTSYVLKLSDAETILHLHYIIAQTRHQGCCYYDASTDEPGIAENLIGADALSVDRRQLTISIAALDAVFGSIKRIPDETISINGHNTDKAKQRSQVVCNEAYRLLKKCRRKKNSRWTITNVGVIGSMLSLLAEDRDIDLRASDFYRGVAGHDVHGCKVHYGTETPALIAQSDIAIVTGMALANNTLPQIMDAAKKSDTKLVLFAQTGANFADEYTQMGIDAVVSEPFPFYLVSPGPTRLDLYRSGTT